MRRRHRHFLLPYWTGRVQRAAVAHIGASTGDRKYQCEGPRSVLEAIRQFLHSLYSTEGLRELIRSGGAPLVCTIVFIETGFFVGFFLPGDSLLITAGIFSSAGVIPLRWLLLPAMFCAIAGDQIGYWIGRSAGSTLYRREDSLFFRRSHLQRAHDFYAKYGGRAVILARFMPIVRTFCPPVAGAAKMTYSRYVLFDLLGGVLWIAATVLGGYSLGRAIPNIGQYIHYVIAVVIILSVLPPIIGLLRSKNTAKNSGAAAAVGDRKVD